MQAWICTQFNQCRRINIDYLLFGFTVCDLPSHDEMGFTHYYSISMFHCLLTVTAVVSLICERISAQWWLNFESLHNGNLHFSFIKP